MYCRQNDVSTNKLGLFKVLCMNGKNYMNVLFCSVLKCKSVVLEICSNLLVVAFQAMCDSHVVQTLQYQH